MSLTPTLSETERTTLGSLGASNPDSTHLGTGETRGLSHGGAHVHSVSLPVGTLINGRYRVVEVLGEGGMGVVYKVTDGLFAERPLALKTIRSGFMRADALSFFKAEFRTLTELKHPNIGTVFDFEPFQVELPAGDGPATSGDSFFTMEYVEGQDAFAATSDATWPGILDVLVQICRALTYIHSRRVIHYDLKPANVIVAKAGGVKVLDFGVAGDRSQRGFSGPVGTPAYMAPEMFTSPDTIDHRVDLYALGILAFQLFSRDYPFRATSVAELREQHLHRPVVFDAQVAARIPEWLRVIVLKLCAKEPAERFRSANAVVEAINAHAPTRYELETSETKESYILSSRFIGREQELDRAVAFVGARLSGARAASSPALFVAGPSGVGKSRLVRELRHRLQLARRTFVEASCYEGAPGDFEPIAELCRHLVRVAEATGGMALTERHRDVLIRVGAVEGEYTKIEHVLSRTENEAAVFFEGLSEFIVGVSERVPLVLYLNDLQWARRGTAGFLGHLLAYIGTREAQGSPTPVAILGSYRDDEIAGRPIAQVLARAPADTMSLGALAGRMVGRLIGSMLGIDEPPEAFVARVEKETNGNPFFVEEVMRALVGNGSVYLQQGRWAARTSIGDLSIPRSVAETFQRRLELIELDARNVLEVVAMAGRPVPAEVVVAASPLSEQDTLNILVDLQRRQLLVREMEPNQRVLFRCWHDRVRESAVSNIVEHERRRLHLRLGEAIERVCSGELERHSYALAEHFWHGGNEEKALRYARRGARRALDAGANEIARKLYGYAQALAPADDRVFRLEIEESLAELDFRAQKYDAALAGFEAVLVRLDNADDQARLQRRIGYVYAVRGDKQAGTERYWMAIALLSGRRRPGKLGLVSSTLRALITHLVHRWLDRPLKPARSEQERARLLLTAETYVVLGELAYMTGDSLTQMLGMVESLNAAERAGPSVELAYARSTMAAFFYAPLGWIARAKRMVASSRSMLGVDDAEHIYAGGVDWNAAFVHVQAGDLREAERSAIRAAAIALKNGDVNFVACATMLVYHALVRQGRLREAEERMANALQLVERMNVNMAPVVCMQYGSLRTELGDAQRGMKLQNSALERARDPAKIDWGHCHMGEDLYTTGKVEESIKHLEIAVETRRKHSLNPEPSGIRLYALLARVMMATLLDHRVADAQKASTLRKAKRLVDQGLTLTRSRPWFRASALLTKALFEWHSGRKTAAAGAFDEALRVANAQGARLAEAEAYYEFGRTLACGDADERARAAEHLALARELYESFDARAQADNASRALAALGRRTAAY